MTYICNHIRLMQGAGVDFIEVGYRNGSAVKIDKIGRTGLSDNAYIEAIRAACPDANLGVIVHAHNITEQDIYDMAERGIKLLRFCANAKSIDRTAELAALAKSVGMISTINIVRISSYTTDTLQALLDQINARDHRFDVIYAADSNGNLTPEHANRVYRTIKGAVPHAELGFHAHDNIGQAMSNTISVMENFGVTYVDASLLGMGKGIGNLRLEQLVAYLNRVGATRYDPLQIICAAHLLRNDAEYFENEDYSIDIISGLNDLSVVERDRAFNIWQTARQQALA